jgi:hypothetical protein
VGEVTLAPGATLAFRIGADLFVVEPELLCQFFTATGWRKLGLSVRRIQGFTFGVCWDGCMSRKDWSRTHMDNCRRIGTDTATHMENTMLVLLRCIVRMGWIVEIVRE